MVSESTRHSREATVMRHIEAENAGDIDGTVETFTRARFEDLATGAVDEGEDAVREHYLTRARAMPSVLVEVVALHHSDTAVIVETRAVGRHDGSPPGGPPPTGNPLDFRGVAFFDFDGDRLIGERVYYDTATIRRQMTGEGAPEG